MIVIDQKKEEDVSLLLVVLLVVQRSVQFMACAALSRIAAEL